MKLVVGCKLSDEIHLKQALPDDIEIITWPNSRTESLNHSNLLTLDNLNTVYIHFSGYKRISKE